MKGHYDHQIKEKRYTQEEVDKAIHDARVEKGRTDEDFARKRAELDRREQALEERTENLAKRYRIPVDLLKYGLYGKPNPKDEPSNINPETEREIAIWKIAERYGADPTELKDLNLSIEETEKIAESGEYNKEVQMEGKSSREIYADIYRHKGQGKDTLPAKGKVEGGQAGEHKTSRELLADYWRDKSKEEEEKREKTPFGATVRREAGTPLNESIPHWPYYKRPANEPKEEKTPGEEESK